MITVGTDSYITVAEATTILEDHFDTDNWTGATTADQELALKKAAKNIDNQKLRFVKYDEDQVLEFPRNCLLRGQNDSTDNVVPDKIKEAQALEALGVLDYRANKNNSQTATLQAERGITSKSVEGTSVSYDKDYQKELRTKKYGMMSEDAKMILKPWIATVFARR